LATGKFNKSVEHADAQFGFLDTIRPFNYPRKKQMHPARVPSQDEVLQAFRRAGFASLTPLQQGLIPLLLKNRDAVAEVPDGAGASTAIAAPLVLALRGAGPALRALILLPNAEQVGTVARAFTRFGRVVRDAPAFVALGEIEDARREQRRLEREATIVAGTAGRIIDHIRRGGLSFGSLQTVVIREPAAENAADFVKDVQFIVAKWTDRPRIILLARPPLREENELVPLLHHPLSIDVQQKGGPETTLGTRVAVISDGVSLAASLARVVLGMRLPPVLAFYSPRANGRDMADVLRSRGLRAVLLPPGGRQNADRREALLAFSRRSLDVLLVPLAAGVVAPDLEDLAPTHIVFVDFPTGPLRSPGGMLKRAAIVALGEREKDLGRLQEAIGVAFDRKEFPDADELLTGAIDRVLRRVRDEDKAELARLRTRIRRQVPFLLRPFFMASLLKSMLALPSAAAAQQLRGPAAVRQRNAPAGLPPGAAPEAPVSQRGPRGRFGRNAPDAGRPQRRPEAPRRSESPRRPEAPRPAEGSRAPRAGGDYAQLFVSVGRNRRVYARDLTELFTEKLQLAPGDIGGVRVFDKYSFVDISASRAEEAISTLTGLDVKGRSITVNYAKKKEEKEAT
jgi:ATP-dependent RNA helicase DeaD